MTDDKIKFCINTSDATKTFKRLSNSMGDIRQGTMLKAIKAMKIKQDKNMSTLKDPWTALTSSHNVTPPYSVGTVSQFPPGTVSQFPPGTLTESPVKKEIIGKAVGDCKAGKLCMIESSVWVDEKTKKPRTEFRIVYKNVKENELLYDCETKEINSLCHDFMQVVKEFKLTPRKLADMLEQKKNTEIIINN